MKRLSINISTLRKLIEDDRVYIDKTKEIYELITSEPNYFLSRPRRFGKSLLISTLYEIYLGNKELFKDTWIYKSDYDWEKYQVLHFDFSSLDFYSSKELKESLSFDLDLRAQNYGLDLSSAKGPNLKIKLLIKELSKFGKVVILVDEYDAPLVNNLDNVKVAQDNIKVLKSFFTVVKSLDSSLKAIFITGVSKFAKTSVFSGLNNLTDITTSPKAAKLLGYTFEEIEDYFSEYLKLIETEQNLSKEELLTEIKCWYNGYQFSPKEIKLYNPYSLLYLFSNHEFKNYWIESATPSFLIELLKKQFNDLENLKDLKITDASLGTFDINKIPIVPILFQTGYLTIDKYDPETKEYSLKYPNYEVEESFKKYIVTALANTDLVQVDNALSAIRSALNDNDMAIFCKSLQSLFANIPYQLHINQEKYYHSLFQFLGNLIGVVTTSEVSTDKGRIDLVITTKTNIYIFELKFNKSAEKAIEQIEDNQYAQRYFLDKKPITLIGISINRKAKHLSIECKSKKI